MKLLDKVLDVNVTVFIDRLSVLWRKSKPAMGCLFTGTETNETNIKQRMSLGEHFFLFPNRLGTLILGALIIRITNQRYLYEQQQRINS